MGHNFFFTLKKLFTIFLKLLFIYLFKKCDGAGEGAGEGVEEGKRSKKFEKKFKIKKKYFQI